MMAHLSALLIPPSGLFIDVTCGFFIDKSYNWKNIHKSREGQEGGILPFLALSLLMKVLGKGVAKAGIGYNNMDQMDNNF